MQDQVKNLPKKYFQITRDRMVAYVRLDEVLGILNTGGCNHDLKDGGYGKHCTECNAFVV